MEQNKIKIGDLFGRLTVTAYSGRDKTGSHHRWLCKCDCGNEKVVYQGELKKGKTKSCGCLRKEITRNRSLKHGFSVNRKNDRFYRIWAGVMQRCTNNKNPAYDDYGGRGISVDSAWYDFLEFKKDMYETYLECLKKHKKPSIERKDVNGDYCKDNCCWIPLNHQSKNQRRIGLFLATNLSTGKKYITKNMSEFASEHNLHHTGIGMCLRNKQKKHKGWTFKWYVEKPKRIKLKRR